MFGLTFSLYDKNTPNKTITNFISSRTWCSLNVDFREANSVDPESIDSTFPTFDVNFVPINKDNGMKRNKINFSSLRVSQRLGYNEFKKNRQK